MMVLWFAVMLVSLALEAVFSGLNFICLAFGAMITMIFSTLYRGHILYQIAFFILVSLFLKLLVWLLTKKLMGFKEINMKQLRGRIIKIRSTDNRGYYEIYLGGKYFKGICDKKLEIGDKAVVLGIEGEYLKLKKYEL